MALERLWQLCQDACQSAAEVYGAEKDVIKAAGAFGSALWQGKKVTVQKPESIENGTASVKSSTTQSSEHPIETRDLDDWYIVSLQEDTDDAGKETGQANLESDHHESLPTEPVEPEAQAKDMDAGDDETWYEAASSMDITKPLPHEPDPPETPLKPILKDSKKKASTSESTKKGIKFSPDATETTGDIGAVHDEIQPVSVSDAHQRKLLDKANKGYLGLSETVRENLLAIIENEGAEGVREYLATGVNLDHLLKIYAFLVKQNKLSDASIEEVLFQALCKELAASAVLTVLHSVLADGENNEKDRQEKRLGILNQHVITNATGLVNVAVHLLTSKPMGKTLLDNYEPALVTKVHRHIREEVKALSSAIDEHLDNLSQKHKAKKEHKTDSAFINSRKVMAMSDELSDKQIITMLYETKKKLTQINEQWMQDSP